MNFLDGLNITYEHVNFKLMNIVNFYTILHDPKAYKHK